MSKIVVISDLHYSISNKPDVYDVDKVGDDMPESVSVDIYELLLSALEGEKEPADLLILCGDFVIGRNTIADKKKSLEAFVSFLEEVERSDKILRSDTKAKRIIIVPGNHDIMRGRAQIYKDFKDKLKRYLTPFTDITTENPDSPTFVFDDLRLIVDCETTVSNSSTVSNKIVKWIKMVKKSDATSEQKQKIVEEMEAEKILDIPSVTGKAHKRFIKTAKKHFENNKYNDYLKMVVTHHPLLSGVEPGKTIKSYNYTVGGYGFMKSAMEFGYTVFLHGHIHEKSCIEVTDYANENPFTAVQLGIPSIERDLSEHGIFVIDTNKPQNGSWSFSAIYKTLSSYTHGFKQASVLCGKKGEIISENSEMTILVDREITELINDGVVIKNGDCDRVEAASYDCALGREYKRSSSKFCDWNNVESSHLEVSSKPSEIVLKPQEAVLIYTDEEFDVPINMVMHASPISSWLRRGLHVEISYFVDPGFKGRFCFPVINESTETISISSREPIMSIEIIRLSNPCEKGWSERHQDIAEKRNKQED